MEDEIEKSNFVNLFQEKIEFKQFKTALDCLKNAENEVSCKFCVFFLVILIVFNTQMKFIT